MRLCPNALAIRTAEGDWSLAGSRTVDRLCAVLACDMRVEPGNRVLLRAGNSVMLYAAWLAVARIGAVVVATMPLLRRRELATIVDKARIRHALCEVRLAAELGGVEGPDGRLRTLTWGDGELEGRLATQPTGTAAVDTAQDDPCQLAFTSGTTGQPKATVHFHRDVLAMADTLPRTCLAPGRTMCSPAPRRLPSLYGLGAELVFPLRLALPRR
jgi:2-aminobenzoate-CoA ligase